MYRWPKWSSAPNHLKDSSPGSWPALCTVSTISYWSHNALRKWRGNLRVYNSGCMVTTLWVGNHFLVTSVIERDVYFAIWSPLWSRSKSLLLTQRARVWSPVGSFSWLRFFLEFSSTVGLRQMSGNLGHIRLRLSYGHTSPKPCIIRLWTGKAGCVLKHSNKFIHYRLCTLFFREQSQMSSIRRNSYENKRWWLQQKHSLLIRPSQSVYDIFLQNERNFKQKAAFLTWSVE